MATQKYAKLDPRNSKEGIKQFFFEKKNQKTFVLGGWSLFNPAGSRRFLRRRPAGAFFSKKRPPYG
jgi:hypothetical protein